MDAGFLVSQTLTGLAGASSLFLVASGLTIIFGVTRIVNFAHGSLYMLGAYLAWTATTVLIPVLGKTTGFWSSIPLAMLLTGLLGLLLEVCLLRWLYKAPELFQLLATFGVVLIVQDLVPLIWGPNDLLGPRAPGLKGAVMVMDWRVPHYDLFMICIGPLVWAGLWLLFQKTRWGILVRAATADRETVSTLGINQAWLFRGVLFLGAALAGLAGALQLPKEPANGLMDIHIIAEAFVVTVIGGMGNVTGAGLAALIIGLLQAFGILMFPKITLILVFLVMGVVLTLRPGGLLGKGEHHEPPGRLDQGPHDLPFPAPRLLYVLCGGLLLAPLIAGDYLLFILTEILLLSLFALSLNLVMGLGGMISFGHAAWFGLGAYGAALLVHHFDSPMGPALIAAPLLSALAAAGFGWFCLRMSGVYLAMLTLAFAQIVWSVAVQWTDLTGGDNGLIGIWPPSFLADRASFYYLTLFVCGLAIWLLYRVSAAPWGLLLRASRDSRKRLEADGANSGYVRWLAFVISGAAAGLAGGLYSFSKGSIDPQILSIPTSVDGLTMVLLGGIQTMAGPIVGSAAMTFLKANLMPLTDLWRMVMGGAILVMVLAFPHGLVGNLIFFLRSRRRPSPEGDRE